MQKIIALDIGSYSIKAIEILNHFKTYEISNFYENVVPHIEEVPKDSITSYCIAQLFAENNIKADRIVAAMPGQYISSRIIPFTFSDPGKIEASIYAEIEDTVPFDLDDMIMDHQILGTFEKQTHALAVLTKKKFIASYLDHLQKSNIDPKLIDVDSLSLYNLCNYLPEANECYAIIDIGHEKTSICVVKDSMLRMFRTINLGGRYFTEFLSRDLQVSYSEAQRLKHKVSRITVGNDQGEGLSPEDLKVSHSLTKASNTLIKELGRTVYAFKTWDKAPIKGLYLSGASIKIQNFSTLIEENLRVDAVNDEIQQSDLKIKDHLLEDMGSMTQGIAIGLRAVTSIKRKSEINLRRDEFAFVQDYSILMNSVSTFVKFITFALILLSIGYGVRYYTYNQQIDKIKSQYLKEAKANIPAAKTKFKKKNMPISRIHRESINLIKRQINGQTEAINRFVDVNRDSGSLVALQYISANVSKDVKVNVVEYIYNSKPDGSGVVKLRVEADSFDTIVKFEEELKKIKVFEEVVEKSSDSKPGTDTKIAVIETIYMPGEFEE